MTESERTPRETENGTNAANWYPDDAPFAERYGLQERFSLSHCESYEGVGRAGVTEPLYLSNGDIVVFAESMTPVPERKESYIFGDIPVPGNPAYESRSSTALLFSEDGFLMGYASGATKTDEDRFLIDTFAFNIDLVDLLPDDIASVIRYIHENDEVLGLKVDKAYRGKGKAEEVLMLLFAYIQNKGVKIAEVGTDSTMRVDKKTGEVSSFYKRTGATGPKNSTEAWEYDINTTMREYATLLAELAT